MFTSAQKESVINNVGQAVHNAFHYTARKMETSNGQLAIIYNEDDETATWQHVTEADTHDFTEEKIIAIIKMVVSNAMYVCAGQTYSQNGLAIGGDASSELANLFLAQVERNKFLSMAAAGADMHRRSPMWKLCKRYMDDMINATRLQYLIPSEEEYELSYSLDETGNTVTWCGLQIQMQNEGFLSFFLQYF